MKIIFLVLLISSCSSMIENANTFTASGLVSGSLMSKASCNQNENDESAIWVAVKNKGECIRYFSSGLESGLNKEVVFYFHGDRLTTTTRGISSAGRNYNKTPYSIIADVENHSFDAPIIYVSRPGVYGSSGDHKQRRRFREVEIMREAVKKLIEKYSIKSVVLSGQSGGGHIVASLLTDISNVSCAVITSGVTAVQARVFSRGWDNDITGYNDYYDPIKHVSEIKNSELEVFVVGDPLDSNVPFSTQKLYYKELISNGINAHLIKEKGKGSSNHGLSHRAKNPYFYCG